VTTERVRNEISDNGVVSVILARPDKHNALDLDMFVALRDAVTFARDNAARCVLLYGEGPSFCSGLDFPSFTAGGGLEVRQLLARDEGELANLAQQVVFGWIQLEAPVIAAVTGACLGGGLQIALGADIRVATPDAKLSLREISYGLVPDMAITQTLPALVGIDMAKELAFTGRTLTGAEGYEIGLVTRLADDPIDAATALADEIASKSRSAVRAAKKLFNTTWASSDAGSALALETSLQESLIAALAPPAKRP
jgi:enoyl-CoA hydratase/carnithine racemase